MILSQCTEPEDRSINRGIGRYNQGRPSCRNAGEQEDALQLEDFRKHPVKLLDELRWACQAVQTDSEARAMLLKQYPDLDEHIDTVLNLLCLAEYVPEERIAAIMKENLSSWM